MIHIRRMSCWWPVILLVACLLTRTQGLAQKAPPKARATSKAKSQIPETPPKEETTPAPAPEPPKTDPLGRSTPYGCVMGFLKAVNDGDLGIATQYLDTKLPDDKAKELAAELKAVLDASLSSSLNKISKDEQGSLRDNLRISRESIGVAKTPNGDLEIYLDRVERPQQVPVWLFAPETLAKIPEAYAHLEKHDRLDALPEPLRTVHFFGIPLWRWISIFVGLGLSLLLSSVVARLFLWIFRIALHKGKIQNEEEILRKLRRPVRILLLALAVAVISTFGLSVLARHYWESVSGVLFVIGTGWLLGSIIDLAASAGMRRSIATGVQQKIAVITLVQRLTKILVAFAVLLILLKGAGINVTAMLTGLGIGGVALALAAQNALQDLFGGISIIVRDTIRVGDFCRVADQTGTIEEIGLSSTRLRTLDRTVVSIPNSKIAQVSSENFTLRDKFWFHHLLSLRPDTSEDQLDRVLAGIRTILVEDRNIEAETSRVVLLGFMDASFQIEIFAYVKTDTYPNFLKYQQRLLQDVLAAISEAGARLAMTSQTTYLETTGLTEEETTKLTRPNR
jgi:MscS family membrane protein